MFAREHGYGGAVTFYVTQAQLVLPPDAEWFPSIVNAWRKLNEAGQTEEGEEVDDIDIARHDELIFALEDLTGVTIADDQGRVEGITLSFMHYDQEACRLVLSVNFTETGAGTDNYATPFDRLFDYDPEKLKLTDEDRGYVIARIDPSGRLLEMPYVIQPAGEPDTPHDVCVTQPVSHEFLQRLLAAIPS